MQASSRMPLIDVIDVYKSFKNVDAVKGINLKIKEGEFVAVLGPNGAGKTTLVEMIEGIQKPDKGDILLMGKKWKGNEDELHRLIGLSLQETRFIDKLTVLETLRLFASFYNLGKERCNEIIKDIGLEEKTKSYVNNLSGGQKQRLALGIALLNNPKILLLDEPTTGLDPNARREIWDILLKLKKKSHTSLILTTHYMEEAERLCDYIIIMDNGKVIKEGTLVQLLNYHEGEKIIEFYIDQDDYFDALKSAPFDIAWSDNRDRGTIFINRIETDLQKFLDYLNKKNIRLKNIDSRKKTLDDLFTSLTGRHLHE